MNRETLFKRENKMDSAIIFLGGRFYILTKDNTLIASDDGSSFCALSEDDKLIASDDGITWGNNKQRSLISQGEIVAQFFIAVLEELNQRKHTTIWQKIKNSLFN